MIAPVLARSAASILLAYAPGGDVAFSLQDAEITESSALVALPSGDFVTTNDSGDSGRVFVVSPAGRTLREVDYSDDARDVEALAPVGWPARGDRIWVGDTGDNSAARDSILLRQVAINGADAGRVTAEIRLRYPDGAHDAETLMTAPDGRLLIVTKGFLGGTLYAVPTATHPAGATLTLEPLSSTGAMLAMATDGAFLPDGRHFLVRGYTSATLYAWPSLDRLGSMPLPRQKQGEGLGVAADGSLWLSSEGVHADVLRIGLSPALQALVGGAPAASSTPSTSSTSAPASGQGGPATSGSDPSPSASAEDGGSGPWPWVAGGVVAAVLAAYVLRALRR